MLQLRRILHFSVFRLVLAIVLSQPSPKLRFLAKMGIRLTTRVCGNIIDALSFKNVINTPLLARLDGYRHTTS